MKSYFFTFILTMLFFTSTFTASFAQTVWTKDTLNNPVMGPGPSGSWDDINVSLACVILLNDTLHMWYDGNFNNTGSINNGIGHAKSVDGINWIKDTLNNPVLTPGPSSWDSYLVSQAAVLFNTSDSLLHMWYMGEASSNGPLYIGHATSIDGSIWTKDTNPALSPGSWDNYGPNGPSVVLVNDTLHMWYGGFSIGSSLVRIGHATSSDWITWQKDPANPVLNPGTFQDWDYPQVRGSKAIYDGVRFHIFYTGGSFITYDVGYAYSEDGTNWTKYNDTNTTGNPYINSDPVLTKGSAGSWDEYWVGNGSVLFNDSGDSLKMWYSGSDNGVLTTQIGYATARFDTSFISTISVLNENIPNNYVLQQNYPNPFNPSTTIEFSIPKTEFVTLKIYNLLGQEVATLVSERLRAGSYTYSWDAGVLASGVYYYNLTAGEFQEVKKMILLR